MFIYTTVQKFGVSNIIIFLNTKDTLNCSNVKVKTFMSQKIYISNTLCNFGKKVFWTFYSLKKCIMGCTKILNSTTVFNIVHISWAANQHIRMISEGPCNTEGWGKDAENSGINYILIYIYML